MRRAKWTIRQIWPEMMAAATGAALLSWRLQHGEVGDGRTYLRGPPKGMPGRCQTVARLRDHWRHSNHARRNTGRFYGPGDVVRDGRQKSRRSRHHLCPAREATTFSSH